LTPPWNRVPTDKTQRVPAPVLPLYLQFCMDVAFTVGFMTFFSVFTFMFNVSI